ncbi:WG repeat-containing protein [Bacteroidota bacterium]
MNSIITAFWQKAILLSCVLCTSLTQAQVTDFNNLNVFDFYHSYYDNVIDTSGNILFDEEWTYIVPLEECEKFFGIKFLKNTYQDHVPRFDGIPAEFAILSPDGSKKILNYDRVEFAYYDMPIPVVAEGAWGLIDCENQWVLKPTPGLVPVAAENFILLAAEKYDEFIFDTVADWDRVGIMDIKGNILAEPKFSEVYSFSWWEDPPFVAMKGNSSSLLDSRGKVLIPMGDYFILPSVSDESVWVISETEEKVYYPQEDRWVTENTDELMKGLYGCRSGFKPVDIEESYYYASWECKDGSVRIYADLESVRQSFLHPYRRIEKDGKFGVISKRGDTILPCIYDNIYDEYNQEIEEHNVRQCVFEGMISVELDGNWGLIDTSGLYRTHLVYNELQGVSEGIVAAGLEGKTGFIDITGKKVIPFVFDWTARPWKNGIGRAYLGESEVLVNRSGRIIASELGDKGPSSVKELTEEAVPRSEWWLRERYDDNDELFTGETYLDPAGAGLTFVPEELALFPDVEEIELGDNYLSSVDFDFTQFRELRSLGLGGNQFSKFPAAVLPLKKLNSLNLSNNLLTEIPREISNMKKLSFLYLNDNRIKELPEDLGALKSLSFLDLRNNQLKMLPESLLKLNSLEYLLIKGNPIPPSELERIKELRPDLELEEY